MKQKKLHLTNEEVEALLMFLKVNGSPWVLAGIGDVSLSDLIKKIETAYHGKGTK